MNLRCKAGRTDPRSRSRFEISSGKCRSRRTEFPRAPHVSDPGTELEFAPDMTSLGWTAALGIVVLVVGCAEASDEEINADDQAMTQSDMGSAQRELSRSFPAVLVARREATFYADQKSKTAGASRGAYCDVVRLTNWVHERTIEADTSFLIAKNSVVVGRGAPGYVVVRAFLDTRGKDGAYAGSAQMQLECTGRAKEYVPTAADIQEAFAAGGAPGFLKWDFIPVDAGAGGSAPSR